MTGSRLVGRGRRAVALLLALVVAVTGLTALRVTQPTERAVAVVGSQFTPGNIISDAVFYNPGTMDVAGVQAFLDSKVARCTAGYICLKSYRVDTWTRAATSYCAQYTGAPQQSAAEIIVGIARACGINPQALIVLLQKEQGLISSTAPTQYAYDRATGYGCPDTAPCNAEFFGLYNQLFLAAQQFKRYRANPTSYGYRAGRVNTILWSPNTACGSSQLYIENQATAGLYNYTPYRPNAAALNNLYGTGDGCSSYGNRNFWRTFNDWFGDTQGGGWLVKSASDPTVFLATTSTKHPIADLAMYNSLVALGPYRVVSDDYLASLALGGPATNYLRDPTTGEIWFVGDGVRNRFPDCDLVAAWGSSCERNPAKPLWIDVMPSSLARFAVGPAVTRFGHSTTTGQIYFVDDGEKRGVHSFGKIEELAAEAGGPANWISHSQTTLDMLPSGVDYLADGMNVRTATSSSRYLVDQGELLPVTGDLVAQFGLAAPAVVAETTIQTVPAAPALALMVSCGSIVYTAGGGVAYRVPSSGGLPVTQLSDATCAMLPKSATTVTGAIFLRVPATGWIYSISGGKKHFMQSIEAVNAINGPGPAVFIPTSQSIVDAIPTGSDVLGLGRLVKSSSAPTVYFVDGFDRKIPITSFDVPAQFGVHGYSVVSDAALSAYTTASAPLSVVVTCGTQTYLAGGGLLYAVPNAGGLPATALSDSSCAALPKASTPVTGALFLRVSTSGWIYAVSGGQRRFMQSMESVYAMNGSAPLVLVPTSQSIADSIPAGPDVLGIGRLVKSASAPTVYFVDGFAAKIPITSFEMAGQFGSSGYTVASDAALAGYATAAAPLSIAVTCASQTYVAGGGVLYAVPSSGGLPTVALSEATCAMLPRSSTPVTGAILLRVPSSGSIYSVSGGQKNFMSTMDAVYAANGSAPLVFIAASQSVVDGIPTGAPG